MDKMQNNAEDNDAGRAVRLQVALARAGVASRRHAEEIIRDGRVKVNGKTITDMGVKVDASRDVVEVDGVAIARERERTSTVMLNKPVGFLSAASDQHGGRVVVELLKGVRERLVPVGRLDKDSCGLLLMSNDGDLIQKITHPRYEHTKEYEVSVVGRVARRELAMLRGRMEIDGYLIRNCEVELLRSGEDSAVLRFVLHEGRNRQIRKMCAKAGLRVASLKRVAVGALRLGDLADGRWRELDAAEIRKALQPAGARGNGEGFMGKGFK